MLIQHLFQDFNKSFVMPHFNAFVIYFLLLTFVSCRNPFNNEHAAKVGYDQVTKACLISDVTSFDLDSKEVKHYPDSIVIYSYQNFLVLNTYKLDRFYSVFEKENVSEVKLVKEVKSWAFFVYKLHSKAGAYFDSLTAQPRIINADSFLLKNTPKFQINEDIENHWNLNACNADKSVIEKVFSAKNANQSSRKDTLKLFFSDLINTTNYSISKKIDEKNKSHLFSVQILLNHFYDSASKVNVPRLESFVEIRSLGISNKEVDDIKQLVTISETKYLKNLN